MVRKITELEKVLIQKSKPPDRTRHFLNKAVKLGLENKYAESIVCLDRVIRINPKLAIAWYYKGTALNVLGQFQEAIICLENVHRNWCEAWNQKGIAYANLKKYFEAITTPLPAARPSALTTIGNLLFFINSIAFSLLSK